MDTSVLSEIVDFGSGRDLSVFATTGIVYLFRGLQKSENEALGQKMLFLNGHYGKSWAYASAHSKTISMKLWRDSEMYLSLW
jgi:hypothetical protein